MAERTVVEGELFHVGIAPAPLARAVPAIPLRTLADLIAEVILRGKSPETRRAYRVDLQDFLIWLGVDVQLPAQVQQLRDNPGVVGAVESAMSQLQRVSEADIQAYLLHLGAGLAPATIARRLTPLRLLFGRLHRYHLIAVNPMEDIRGPKLAAHSATVWLSRAEARRLERACEGDTLRDLRDHALMVFMLATGLRASEAIGIEAHDLATMDGHQVAWITGKGNVRARVKIAPRAVGVLTRYLAAASITQGAVFRRLRRLGIDPDQPRAPRGYAVHGPLTYSGLKFILQQRFHDAGLSDKLSPHSLRHTFVTLALKGGAPLTKVQAAARHASPQTTMRYAHEQDELDDNAVDYVTW